MSVDRAVDDPRLKDVVYVVEASSFEQSKLWCEFAREAAPQWGRGDVPWTQDPHGWCVGVGTLAGLPVNVCLTFARINGRLVLFHDAVSRVVDHAMIEEWLKEHVPAYAGHQTNADNFSHCLRYVRAIE